MAHSSCLALLAALAVTACVALPASPEVTSNPSYQNGYSDGCSTAAARSRAYDKSVVRNEKAFAEDAYYQRGWNTGFRECGSPATQKDPNAAPSVDWQKTGPLN